MFAELRSHVPCSFWSSPTGNLTFVLFCPSGALGTGGGRCKGRNFTMEKVFAYLVLRNHVAGVARNHSGGKRWQRQPFVLFELSRIPADIC